MNRSGGYSHCLKATVLVRPCLNNRPIKENIPASLLIHERQSQVVYLEILLCTVDVHSLNQVYKFNLLKSRVIDFSILRGDCSKIIQQIFVAEGLN